MTLYRTVYTYEREPKESGTYITNLGKSIFITGKKKWFNDYGEGSKEVTFQVYWWLDIVTLPTQQELDKEVLRYDTYDSHSDEPSESFEKGANYILNKLKG